MKLLLVSAIALLAVGILFMIIPGPGTIVIIASIINFIAFIIVKFSRKNK